MFERRKYIHTLSDLDRGFQHPEPWDKGNLYRAKPPIAQSRCLRAVTGGYTREVAYFGVLAMQLAGELTKISLPSLIQLLRNGELTGKVCLTHGANTAFLYVDGGRIVHAETDTEQGRAALLELFLWTQGTFSFVEAEAVSMPHTVAPEEPIDKLVREGLNYLEKKKYLEQLRINGRTVLARSTERYFDNAVYQQLDGRTPLGDICAALGFRRWDYVHAVHEIISRGLANVVEVRPSEDSIKLPSWVISRLKQDNPDLTQAIVEMVIWVDRVKCWMYQADADLDRIVDQLESKPIGKAPAEGSGTAFSGSSNANVSE